MKYRTGYRPVDLVIPFYTTTLLTLEPQVFYNDGTGFPYDCIKHHVWVWIHSYSRSKNSTTANSMSSYNTFGPFFQEGQAYARKKDPDTSHEAAENTKGKLANRLEIEILSALKRHPHGLTNHEIVAATGIDWNTATPRIAPLVRKNLVVDSGERRIGPTNRPGIVWKAT